MADRSAAKALIEPRGLCREQAAAYVGISATTFDRLIEEGRMPGPIAIYSRRVWDRHQLDLAFNALPNAGEDAPEGNPFDGVRI